MGEPQLITFTYKELATVLIKHQGIHEGLWAVTVQMGIQAAHIKVGPSDDDVVPETGQTQSDNGRCSGSQSTSKTLILHTYTNTKLGKDSAYN
jgi:hypothetical protein